MSHKSPLLRRILIQDQLPQIFYGTNTKQTLNKRPFAKRLNTEYTAFGVRLLNRERGICQRWVNKLP